MSDVFQKFGGIRPMAGKLGGLPPSTVNSWHANGRIPSWRHQMILASARRHGIPLAPDELTNLKPAKRDSLSAKRDGRTDAEGAEVSKVNSAHVSGRKPSGEPRSAA